MTDNMERHHAAVWAAVETVAAKMMGVSVSRLAIMAGHDATTMNKAKRVIRGVLRWPSMLMISRIAEVAGISFADFGAIVDEKLREQA